MNRNQMLVTLVAAMAAVALMASSPAWAQEAQGGGDKQGGPHAAAPTAEQSGSGTPEGAPGLQAPNAPQQQQARATGRVAAPYGDTTDSSSAGTSVSKANEVAQRRADCFDRSSGQQRVTPECAQYSALAPGWPGHEPPAEVTAQAGNSTVSTVGAGNAGNASVATGTAGTAASDGAGLGSNASANAPGASSEQTSSTMASNSKSSREGRGSN
jgi:hypothetical protein